MTGCQAVITTEGAATWASWFTPVTARSVASRKGRAAAAVAATRSPRPPPRVDPSINIQVRRQIAWAKQKQEYERQHSAAYRRPPQPQAYRKDSLDSEEHRRRREQQEAIEEEARRQRSDRVTLRSMFNTNISAPGERPTGVTLVDGYNVLYMMRRDDPHVAELLAEAEANPGGGALEAAREHLLRKLDVYSAQQGMYVHVVLDAMKHGYCSEHNRFGMIVSFCSRMEADSMIIVKAQEYVDAGVAQVCIVTDDRELSELGTAIRYKQPGQQAVCACSCKALVKLMKESDKAFAAILWATNDAAQRARPALNPVVRQKGSKGGVSSGSGGGGGSKLASAKLTLRELRAGLVQQELEQEQALRQQQRQQPRQHQQQHQQE